MQNWEIISHVPTDKLKPPKSPRSKPFAKKEDFLKLLELCPVNALLGARRQAMPCWFAASGMRRNEMFMLQVDDLLWDTGLIRVVHGKGQKERFVTSTPTRSGPCCVMSSNAGEKTLILNGFSSELLLALESRTSI